MNEFMQAWFPALQWMATLLVIAIVFWLRATIRAEITTVTRAMQDAINGHADRLTQVENEAKDIEPLRKRSDDHTERLARIEEQLKALPGARDFAKLNEKVGEMAGDIKKITAENQSLHDMLERVERSVKFINEAMLSKAQ